MAKKTPKIIAEAKRKKKLFEKTRDRIQRDYVGVRDKEIRNIIKMLNDTRKQVLAEIATSDWKASQVPQLLNAIDRQIEVFRVRAGAQAVSVQDTLWETGKMLIDDPLLATGISVGMPELSTTILESMQEMTIKHITNLSAYAKQRIEIEIRMGINGGKTPFEVMEAVGMKLKDPSIFRTIAARAEAITRTEYGAVYGKAGQLRMEQAVEQVPELKKEWRWSGRGRAEHDAIDGQIRGVKEDFDVPQPGGGTKKGGFPRDPKLPLKSRVNCGCQSLPLIEDWEDLYSKKEPAIAA